MTTLVGRAFFSLATRVVKVTAIDDLRHNVCAYRATASVGQRTVKPARLRSRAAPLAERFNLDRDPSRSLREAQHVAAADRAARLINRSAGLAAQEAHAAILDDARGQTSRLEKAGAPKPDIDAAGVLRHEAARPVVWARLRLRRRVRRSAGFVSAASAANGVSAGSALSVDCSDVARRRNKARSAPSPSRTRANPSARRM